MTNTIVSEGNDTNVSMVKNILAEEESKRAKTNINIRNDSWEIIFVLRDSCKRYPIGVVAGANKWLAFAVRRAGNFPNFRPGRFLDEQNVKLKVSFKDSVGDKRVLSNVLRKNL